MLTNKNKKKENPKMSKLTKIEINKRRRFTMGKEIEVLKNKRKHQILFYFMIGTFRP